MGKKWQEVGQTSICYPWLRALNLGISSSSFYTPITKVQISNANGPMLKTIVLWLWKYACIQDLKVSGRIFEENCETNGKNRRKFS